MCAPSFLIQEVANALSDAIKRGRMTDIDAEKALKNSNNLQINLYDFNWTEAADEFAIARQLNLTVYDSAYLLLSERMNARLITADDKMYQKAKGKFQILLLKDYL